MRPTHKKSRGISQSMPRPTTGIMFASAQAIEPLREITNPERLTLLFWNGEEATVGSEVECGGQKYVAASIEPTILRALTLPTGITSYGSARELLTDIAKIMTEYAGFPENSVAAMSRWAMSTWFPELRPAPGLSLIGPDTTAGRQQFELLRCFSRHPLPLTDVCATGLRSLPMEWQLTLLIQQPELSMEMQRMLSVARKGLGFIPRAGRVLDFQCGVATYTELGGARGSGIIPSLEISVDVARQNSCNLDNMRRQEIASEFQPKLLSYRLANYAKVCDSRSESLELMPSMRELAQNLGACTPDDRDLQAQVPELLRTQDQEIRSAAWLDLNVVIVEAVLAFLHEAKQGSVYVAEIAKAAETILNSRGENRTLEPRAIGGRLGPLGLITEPRDSKGIRLALTGDVSRRVHELAYNLAVPSIQDGEKRCPQCTETQPEETLSKKSALRQK